MKRFTKSFSAWVAFLCALFLLTDCSTAPANEIIYLRTVQIMDDYGWGRPVPVKSLLIPAGWHTRGGLQWKNTLCLNDLTGENFAASSPDGRLMFEILPGYSWQWATNQISQANIRISGCVLAPPRNPVETLHDIVAAYRRGAHVRAVESSSKTAREVYNELYRLYGYYYNAQGITLRTDAVKASIEYQADGMAFEERLTFSWVEATIPVMQSPPVYTYFIRDIATFRAPRGQLQKHEPLFASILASIHDNPVWQNAILQLVANISSNISREAGNRAAIWRNSMNQIGELRIRTWQQNQETVNRVSGSWSRAFRGVDRYRDPGSGQAIELPTGYGNAWSNGMGGYVLCVDPSFDPNTNRSLRGQNWHRIQRQR